MLSTETRERIVKAREHCSVAEIAKAYSVNTSTVYRLCKRMREEGTVEVRTSERGRKPKLSDADEQAIDEHIKEHPDSTLMEIKEALNLPVSIETVRRVTIRLGYSYKKKSIYAAERRRQRRREETRRMERK